MKYVINGHYPQCPYCRVAVILAQDGDVFEQNLTITRDDWGLWITPHHSSCQEWAE